MKQKIVPHLWFDKETKEAAEFLATNSHMHMPGASVEVIELKEVE